MKKITFLAVFLLLFLNSCSEDGSRPEVNTRSGFSIRSIQDAGKSTQKTKAVVNPLNLNLNFTRAMLGVSEIEVHMRSEASEGEGDQKVVFKGAYQFDVLTGKSNPAIEPVPVEPGVYNKAKFKIEPVLPGGNSIEIYGTFKNDLISFDFEFTSDIMAEIEVENEMGMQMNEGEMSEFVVYFDVKALFSGIDINQVEIGDDNVVRINATSNAEMVSKIEKNLKFAMHLEKE